MLGISVRNSGFRHCLGSPWRLLYGRVIVGLQIIVVITINMIHISGSDCSRVGTDVVAIIRRERIIDKGKVIAEWIKRRLLDHLLSEGMFYFVVRIMTAIIVSSSHFGHRIIAMVHAGESGAARTVIHDIVVLVHEVVCLVLVLF